MEELPDESNPNEARPLVSPYTPDELMQRVTYHHPYFDDMISNLLAITIPGKQTPTYGEDDMKSLEAVINVSNTTRTITFTAL